MPSVIVSFPAPPVTASEGVIASASDYDTITDFTAGDGANNSETLNLVDTASLVSDGIIDLTDKIAQTDTGATSVTVASIEVTTGIGVFNDDDAHGGNDLVINGATLAAAIDALLAQDLGSGGETVAFAYDANGDGDAADAGDGTMVFQQVDDAGTDSSSILVFLENTLAVDALITSNGTGANDVYIA